MRPAFFVWARPADSDQPDGCSPSRSDADPGDPDAVVHQPRDLLLLNSPRAIHMPLTIPDEVKQQMREALGVGQPIWISFPKWLYQFFIVEPLVLIDGIFGSTFSEGQQRIISWQTRSPVMDIVAERLPQTLWVVGTAYVVAILIALPIGIYSAYRQYSVFDQAGTFVAMKAWCCLSSPGFW